MSDSNTSMFEYTIAFCAEGANCSQAILQAGAKKFALQLPEEMLKSCSAISAGFGIGGLCSGIIAGVMLLGLVFDETTAHQKSILFFYTVQESLGSLNCCSIAGETNCHSAISVICESLESLILESL
ncbi:MAG: C-GCAxxG-C-C family (seleno)protein [Bacillota bacterium]